MSVCLQCMSVPVNTTLKNRCFYSNPQIILVLHTHSNKNIGYNDIPKLEGLPMLIN